MVVFLGGNIVFVKILQKNIARNYCAYIYVCNYRSAKSFFTYFCIFYILSVVRISVSMQRDPIQRQKISLKRISLLRCDDHRLWTRARTWEVLYRRPHSRVSAMSPTPLVPQRRDVHLPLLLFIILAHLFKYIYL